MTDMQKPTATTSAPAQQTESLEDQNIFFLLGVHEGSDQDKEAFLDELQSVIWEDFLETDSKLLLTTSEYEELQKIKAQKYDTEMAMQEAVVSYLEKLIPDLEDVMMEKALELKADMVRERVAGMKEFHQKDQAALAQIAEAEKLILANNWYSAAKILNTI